MARIYTRKTYSAPSIGTGMKRQSAPVEAFIHHTVTPNDEDFNSKVRQVRAVHAIDRQHRVGNGWPMGGYHWLVFQHLGLKDPRHEASAYQLRPALFTPAAQAGHNSRTLAIAVVGDGREDALYADTAKVIADVIGLYCCIRTVGGHWDVTPTECPGDRIYGAIPRIAKRAGIRTYR